MPLNVLKKSKMFKKTPQQIRKNSEKAIKTPKLLHKTHNNKVMLGFFMKVSEENVLISTKNRQNSHLCL